MLSLAESKIPAVQKALARRDQDLPNSVREELEKSDDPEVKKALAERR